MLVSVIVPSYSMKNYPNLTDAINSLLNQSYPETEIVVVIHISKKLYEKIVKAYGAQNKVRVVFNEQSLGAYAARNVGIRAAQGDILAFLDDDALLFPDWAEQTARAYAEDSSIIGLTVPFYHCGKMSQWPGFPGNFTGYFPALIGTGLSPLRSGTGTGPMFPSGERLSTCVVCSKRTWGLKGMVKVAGRGWEERKQSSP